MTWKTVKIADLGRVVTGNTPPKKNPEFYGDDYPFIKPTDMRIGERYTPVTEENYSTLAFEKYKKSLIPPLSTCVVTIGSIGKKMTLTSEDCFVNQAVNSIIPSKEYNPYFVFYAVKNILHKVKKADTGASSGRENVSKSNFKSLTLEVPENIELQNTIASLLGSCDDLIENNQRRINLLEQAAQNIYKEWFLYMRFPGHEKINIDQDSRLPEGWAKTNLGSLTEIRKGKNITRNSVTIGDVPVVAGGLRPAYYHNKSNTHSPVITISASGANAGYVNIYLNHIWASDCSYIDSSMTEFIYFTHNLLKINQPLLFGLQRGSAQPHVYPKDLKEAVVIIPDLETIAKFEGVVSPFYSQIRVLKKQNERLKKGRDILLPRLMNQTIKV